MERLQIRKREKHCLRVYNTHGAPRVVCVYGANAECTTVVRVFVHGANADCTVVILGDDKRIARATVPHVRRALVAMGVRECTRPTLRCSSASVRTMR